jgi:hypothetical protein
VNAMANKTSKKSAKVAKNAATRRVDAKAAKPRKKAPKSQSRKVAKPPARTAGKRRVQKIKESRSNLNIYTSARFPLMPRRESDRVVGALMPGNAGGAKGPDF